jgi:sRNA-binding protein
MRKVIVVFAVILGIALLAGPAAAQTPPAGKVVLKGNPMGGVDFDHAKHAKLVGDAKCDTCHHASMPEKAMTAKQEKCQSCHTKAATAPMKTTAKLAFHDAMAKKGTCIDCHAKEVAAGKKAPLKCNECHTVKGS